MALQVISKRKFQINELNEMIPLFAELHSLKKNNQDIFNVRHCEALIITESSLL